MTDLAPEILERVIPPLADSERFRRMFDESRTFQSQNADGNKPRRYYDDKQLSPETIRILSERGQPLTVRNRVKPAVNGVLGVVEQNQVDPRAYPRNPPDEKRADVASKVLRFIADQSRWKITKIDALENHLIEGYAAVITEWDGRAVRSEQIRAEEFFSDPRSRKADYSDARWLGQAKWMYSDDAARQWPDYAKELSGAVDQGIGGAYSGLDQDRPESGTFTWIDRKLRRVLIVEMYHQERGDWQRTVFFGGGVLETGVSPYVDIVDGQEIPRCPIEASSCFIDSENRRYGIVQSMIPLQDELNARASRLLHLANTRQIQVVAGEFPTVDADEARKSVSKADGVIPAGYQVAPTNDMSASNASIMAEVSASIDRLAPTPAVLGRQDADNSGRSRLVLQQAGMTELARPLGRFSDLEQRVFVSMWKCARQFMTAREFIRVTKDQRSFEFVTVNEPEYQMEPVLNPVTGEPERLENGEFAMRQVMAPQPVKGPDGQPQVGQGGAPVLQLQPIQIGVENRLADMDMDIEIDTVPDTANLAAETAAAMMQNAEYFIPAYGPRAFFDAWMMFTQIPQKAEMKEILDKGAAEQAQSQQAAQQAAMQMKGAETQAKVGKDTASAQESSARAEQIAAETQTMQLENTVAMSLMGAAPMDALAQ